MTVDEIRENAKSKHECECERLKKQIAEQKERADLIEVKLETLKADYDNLMEMCDELTDENENLKGQVKALKFVIKRFAR